MTPLALIAPLIVRLLAVPLLASGAATAVPSILPIPIVIPPRVSISVVAVHGSPSGPVSVDVRVSASAFGGSALDGTVEVEMGPVPSPSKLPTVNTILGGGAASGFLAGETFTGTPLFPGMIRFTAIYTPASSSAAVTTTADADARLTAGPLAFQFGAITAGSPIPVRVVGTVGSATSDVVGAMALRVDGGAAAACTTARASSGSFACSGSLPALAPGGHSLVAMWAGSSQESPIDASATITVPAVTKPASTSSAKTGGTTPTTTTPSTDATPAAASSPTSDPTAPASSGSASGSGSSGSGTSHGSALRHARTTADTQSSSNLPLIVTAIVIALALGGAGTLLLVLRRRRANAA